MESRDSELPGDEADFTAAVPLEIDEETAVRTDDLLREFAEDAGLETALVVDRSGALVAGISSEAEVTVEIISALVAGASGAMRALVARLGESGAVESLHFGGNRLVYLKETVNRFILVAVAEASRPAGLVRQKAHSIEASLAEVLGEIRPAVAFPESPAPPSKSLRDLARERAAQRAAVLPPEPEWEWEEEPDLELAPEILPLPGGLEDSEFLFDPEPDWEEAFAALDLRRELSEDESEPEEPGEPKEIHEPIDFGEPEIVIEPSIPSPTLDLPVDSPFEEDDWEEKARIEEEEAAEEEDESFESLEEEEELPVVILPPSIPVADDEILFEEEEEDSSDPPVDEAPEPSFPESLFEEVDLEEEDDEEEENDPSIDEESDESDKSDLSDSSDEDAESEEVFEFDEDEDDDEAPTEESPADESPDEIAREIEEMIAEEDEESEIRSAGPFYF